MNNKPIRENYPNEQAYLQALTQWQLLQNKKTYTLDSPFPKINTFNPSNDFKSNFELQPIQENSTLKLNQEQKDLQVFQFLHC